MSAYVLENFSGIRVVQAYAQEQNQIDGFDAISAEYRRKTMWLATLWGIFWPLMQVMAGFAADGGALAGRPAGVAGHHDAGRIRRLQRLSGDADLATHGDRLHRQPVPARHGGAFAHRRSARYADSPRYQIR